MTAPIWTTACVDWEERILAGRPLITFDPLFPLQAAAGLKTFSAFRLPDMNNQRMGDITRPWVQQFVSHIFGAYDESTARRLISEFFLLISKKNTKSTTAAGIMMTALTKNWRPSAEMLIIAPTKEIADNSFLPARDMVKSNPRLEALYHVQENIRTITHRGNDSFMRVVAADTQTVGGKKASWILVDELHIFGKDPKAHSMMREATGGLTSRREGAVLYLTTQSEGPPQGLFKTKLEYAREVRDGNIIDKSFLPVLYEFPQSYITKKLYREKKYWHITNPNYGTSVDELHLEREHQKAEHAGEHDLIDFFAKHLNVEIGMSMRLDRWVGADFWEAAGVAPCKTLDQLLTLCEVCTNGIDGGGLDDLLGYVVLGRERTAIMRLRRMLEGKKDEAPEMVEVMENGAMVKKERDHRRWYVWAHAWAHEIVLERRKELAPKLQDLAKAGDLTIVTNPGDDIQELAGFVSKIYNKGMFPEKHGIGVDPAGLGDIIDVLTGEMFKIPIELITQIPQGWKLNGAIKMTERKLPGKMIAHSGQPLMAHAVGSARTELRSNNTVITKQASGSAKIDPLMALFNAVSLMALNPAPRPSMGDFLSDPIIV